MHSSAYSIVKEQPAQSAFLPRVGRVALNENPAGMRPSLGDAADAADAAAFLVDEAEAMRWQRVASM